MSPRLAALAFAALLAGCGSSTSPSAAPTPEPTPVPTQVPAATPLPTPVPTAAPNRAPTGEFHFTPEPDDTNTIRLRPQVPIKVNASKFSDPDGDPLFLTVAWGDGKSDHIKCGPCRLEHTYRRQLVFELRAEVTDLQHPVSTSVFVDAR